MPNRHSRTHGMVKMIRIPRANETGTETHCRTAMVRASSKKPANSKCSPTPSRSLGPFRSESILLFGLGAIISLLFPPKYLDSLLTGRDPEALLGGPTAEISGLNRFGDSEKRRFRSAALSCHIGSFLFSMYAEQITFSCCLQRKRYNLLRILSCQDISLWEAHCFLDQIPLSL